MAAGFVLDREWVSDYLHHIRQEMRTAEILVNNLKCARVYTKPENIAVYNSLITDVEDIANEFETFHETLEKLMNETEKSAHTLSEWHEYSDFSHLFF